MPLPAEEDGEEWRSYPPPTGSALVTQQPFISAKVSVELARRWRARRQDLLRPLRRSGLSSRGQEWWARPAAVYEECALDLEALARNGRLRRSR